MLLPIHQHSLIPVSEPNLSFTSFCPSYHDRWQRHLQVMFPLLLSAIAIGAGTAMISKTHVDVDLDGDRMVARAIEMLDLKSKLDNADGALRDTLLELRVNSAELTAQALQSSQRLTDDIHGTLACVNILLLISGLWLVLRFFAWMVWVWRGDKAKAHQPVVFLLGPGVKGMALSAGESSGIVQTVCSRS